MTGPSGADRNTIALSPRFRRWLLLVYVALILYVTLYPFEGWHAPVHGWWAFDPSIFHHISRSDTLANILLFMPFGFLFATGRRARTLPLVLFLAFALSLGIESLQACIPGRVSSVLDMATNTAGAGVGAIAASLVRWPRFAIRGPLLERLRVDRVAWLGLAALAAWTTAQLVPFVPSVDVGSIKHGLDPLWLAWRGMRPVLGWRIMVYVLATASLVVCGAAALGAGCAWLTAGWLLAVLPLKVLIVGRQLSPEALLGTVLGVAIGAACAIGGKRIWIAAAIAIPVCVVLAALEPGPPGTVTHAFNWIPLAAQMTQPLNGLANLADQVWPWLALACLYLRLGWRPLWAVLPLVVLLLIGVELVQCLVPGRYPDITVILAGMIAWIAAAAYADREPVYARRTAV